ncbi:MAG: hypothetical protein KKE23_02660, partial [Nanoarchaeota archaeon]|nr:hypothetical protein [Nanoarchaeota archaeon]
TGGTITRDGNYTIHTFTSNGNFSVTSGCDVEVLVVAGGGGGGSNIGGGGGGGGYIYNASYAVTAQSYEITVGTGGADYTQNGSSSTFSTINSTGGGHGGGQTDSLSGADGGSGGGAAFFGVVGTGIAGQGYDGGMGYTDGATYGIGGGGGGASAVGETVTSPYPHGGDGGNGTASSISGTSAYYSGGGGGAGDTRVSKPGGTGGLGGGGNGGYGSATAPAGTPNTGGGGGGGRGSANSDGVGGAGGSGIVIIRYFGEDTTPPQITIISPENIIYSNSTIDFNVSLNEEGDWCGFSLDNAANVSMTKFNDTYFNYTQTDLTEGGHNITFSCNDTAGNMNTTALRYFSVDALVVHLISPGNNTITSTALQTFSCNITDDYQISNLTLYIWNSTGSLNYSNTTSLTGTFNSTSWNYTLPYYDAWKWNCLGYDNASNSAWSAEGNYTLNYTANVAPIIESVSIANSSDPTEENKTQMNFSFVVSDANGASDINVSSATANFTKNGVLREGSCVNVSNIDSNTINFSCSIDMWYFDDAGVWNVSTYVEDNSALSAINNSQNFTYHNLLAIKISPSVITWPSANRGAINVTADYSTLINNTGNVNVSTIKVMAYDLRGEADPNYAIFAENFTVNVNSENVCSGQNMVNASNVTINNALLPNGNLSLGNAQEQLYYCIPQIPSTIIKQAYSSLSNPWYIQVAALLAVFGLKRRKKKKELIDLLNEQLREKYGVSMNEIASLVKEKAGRREKLETVPIGIFKNSQMGPAENLVKYMKENHKMKFSEIASAINRNDRTIWVTYQNASEKMKDKLKAEGIDIPVSIFKDRRLSILESLIIYLRENNLKHVEIANMLGKDQRNISTMYLRAIKKLKKK